jgi:predicted cupin superfamily sugar epimerase
MQGKLLRQVLDKMMTSGYAQNARVQVLLPDGKYYDITSLQLLENKLIGEFLMPASRFQNFMKVPVSGTL